MSGSPGISNHRAAQIREKIPSGRILRITFYALWHLLAESSTFLSLFSMPPAPQTPKMD
jgi:hypothetical protein